MQSKKGDEDKGYVSTVGILITPLPHAQHEESLAPREPSKGFWATHQKSTPSIQSHWGGNYTASWLHLTSSYRYIHRLWPCTDDRGLNRIMSQPNIISPLWFPEIKSFLDEWHSWKEICLLFLCKHTYSFPFHMIMMSKSPDINREKRHIYIQIYWRRKTKTITN